MGVFSTQTHGIIVICNCNKRFFSVIVIEEFFAKEIVTDPKVIDYYLLHRLLQTYKISGLFACYSNC